MWLHRSVVVWLYALSLIPSLFHFIFAPFLFFFLHLYILHNLTKSYLLRSRPLSAIRCRLLTGCIISPPVQNILLMSIVGILFGIVLFVYFTVSNQGLSDNPDAVNAQTQEFQTWINETIVSTIQSSKTSKITPAVIVLDTVVVSSDSAWQTLVAWLLTKGYLSMVTTLVEGQVIAEAITITDIFTFALVGMLGMRIGKSMIGSMTSIIPIYPQWWVQLFITPPIELVRLAQGLVSVAIFSISEGAKVLGLRANKTALVGAVFGINVVVNVASLFWKGGMNPVFGFVGWIISAGLLLYAGREVWKRFRIFKATEISKVTRRDDVEQPLSDGVARTEYANL